MEDRNSDLALAAGNRAGVEIVSALQAILAFRRNICLKCGYNFNTGPIPSRQGQVRVPILHRRDTRPVFESELATNYPRSDTSGRIRARQMASRLPASSSASSRWQFSASGVSQSPARSSPSFWNLWLKGRNKNLAIAGMICAGFRSADQHRSSSRGLKRTGRHSRGSNPSDPRTAGLQTRNSGKRMPSGRPDYQLRTVAVGL